MGPLIARQHSLAPRFGAILKKQNKKKNIHELYKYGQVMQLDQGVEKCVKPVGFLSVGTKPGSITPESRH